MGMLSKYLQKMYVGNVGVGKEVRTFALLFLCSRFESSFPAAF